MAKIATIAFVVVIFRADSLAQSAADSITITFRTHKPPSPSQFVPGEFNNWGPNDSGGIIADTAISKMSYSGSSLGWTKTYTFKIHDSFDPNRTLGDSAYQYKFNEGGATWYSDPLNPEQNASEFNNSVLRLSHLFWFELYGIASGSDYTGFTVGLVHANSDSITAVSFETGLTELDPLTVVDVTGNYNRSLRVLSFTLANPIPQSNYFRLVAHNDKGDSVVYRRISYNVKTIAMPAGTLHGVTLPTSPGDSARFRLHVPGKSLVLLRIAPLGQLPAGLDPIVLHKNTSSNDWWRNVAVEPNTTYEYYYEFSDGKKIHDPWGRETGAQGTRFSTGPAGLSADDYQWGSTDYQRPPLHQLVIYELNVAEISGNHPTNIPSGPGTFQDLIKILPHFNDLGINALELMPVNDYGNIGPSGFSWGYDISHHFALEPVYGTPRDFKELVDSAHARGIAIIVDVVFNHLNDPGPLWQMAPDESVNPYFKYPPVSSVPSGPTEQRPNEDGLVFFRDMDHFTQLTQDYIYTNLKMWIDEYRVDGFRYDYTQGIGWDVNDPTMGILGWANKIAQDYGDSVYQIAEHLPESPALIYHSGLTSGWHDSFRDELFWEAKQQTRPLQDIRNLVIGLGAYPGNDSPGTPSVYAGRVEPVNATVTHDEQSIVFELRTFDNKSEALALIRDKLVGGMMFTSLGIPMLWQGMEFGESRGWANEGLKLSYRPVDWNRQSLAQAVSHFKYYKNMIYQRRYNPALTNGTLSHLAFYDFTVTNGVLNERALVWGFSDTVSSAAVVVAANLYDYPDTLQNVPWLGNGTWYDVFTQSPLTVVDSVVTSLIIPAYSLKVFSNKTDSALGIPVSVEQSEPTMLPANFALHPGYPNPFNPLVHLNFELPASSDLTLRIYNLLGQEIAVLVDGPLSGGRHTVQWHGLDKYGRMVPSGVYFVRMQTREIAFVQKLLLLR
ncbi:MAG: alpha-amylase family glycosyl hydrolase [Bacteroidota bacterium]